MARRDPPPRRTRLELHRELGAARDRALLRAELGDDGFWDLYRELGPKNTSGQIRARLRLESDDELQSAFLRYVEGLEDPPEAFY